MTGIAAPPTATATTHAARLTASATSAGPRLGANGRGGRPGPSRERAKWSPDQGREPAWIG